MRNLTSGALALLSFTAAVAQVGDSWGPKLMSTGASPKWPTNLEGIHAGHIPPPNPSVDAPTHHWGRIALWGHGVEDDSGDVTSTQMYVWDTTPGLTINFMHRSGQHFLTPDPQMFLTGVNCFCAGHTGDKNGDLFIVGGQMDVDGTPGIVDTHLFKFQTLQWEPKDKMTHARWYPSVVPLANGDILTVAGKDASGNLWSDIPELFTFSNGEWSIFNALVFNNPPGAWETFDSDNYPFMYAVHDTVPSVVWGGKRRHSHTGTQEDLRAHILNMNTLQYIPLAGQLPNEGSGAVLWINGTATNPSIKKGVVIKAGGNGTLLLNPPRFAATAATWTMDLDGNPPFWVPRPNMPEGATDCNFVMLPTGKILVVGGAKFDHDYVQDFPARGLEVLTSQMYDPETNTWNSNPLTPMPTGDIRWYHSIAILLPDGSVLSAGSNNQFNGRIYYPKYFDLPRPVIGSAPPTISYGSSFNVTVTSGEISKVTLVRLPSTTHGYDQGQRFIRCDFNGTTSLNVTAPASGGVAPPGYYMLFLISADGAPSHARYVKIG